MGWKKETSSKKLAKKAKAVGGEAAGPDCLLECLLQIKHAERSTTRSKTSTPAGFFAVYIGDERQRFVVPTSYLSHPLFKILLEKTHDEFGFRQSNGLVVPCTVSTFQEVMEAVECRRHGNFDLSSILDEL